MEFRSLCRAKRIDSGKWVEGFYFCMTHDDYRHIHHFIIPLGADLSLGTPIEKIQVEIDANTICWCTGRRDKNGKLMWENDIITINTYSDDEPGNTYYGVVKYSESNIGFCLDSGESWIPICDFGGSYSTEYFVEGNIFDNSELLEVERETD